MARSNSAKAPTICIIMRPAGVVVSMFSVMERKPAPALAIRSMICSTSFSERRQAVELPDHHDVALAQLVEQAVQLGPVPTAAGRGLLEQASAARGLQRFGLQGVGLLVALGYARIAEQQTAGGGLGGFHKRPFANGFGGHGDSSRICFQYPIAELH